VPNSVRHTGGGRKLKEKTDPELVPQIKEVINNHVAGCPMTALTWTYLTRAEMIQKLSMQNVKLSTNTLKRIFKTMGLGSRKMLKKEQMNTENAEQRNEQFKYIASLSAEFRGVGAPVLSIDTKKKEHLDKSLVMKKLHVLTTIFSALQMVQ
jgi:Rhodopirellula transposase DDE domain